MVCCSYIVNQNPQKYGGQQEDYLQKVKETIEGGVKSIQSSAKTNDDLTKLFFSLLKEFGEARQKIASTHKTKASEQFGRRRDLLGKKDFYFTYLDCEYAAYNKEIMSFFASHLKDMNLEKKGSTLKTKKIENKHGNLQSNFEIEILESDELQKRQWVSPPSPADLPSNYPIELYKMKDKLNSQQFEQLRHCNKELKEKKPEIYKRCKMVTLMLDMQNNFPTPNKIHQSDGTIKIQGNIGNLKSFYLLGTVRLLVNDKMYAVSQYLTWLYRDFEIHPVERMQRYSTMLVIHQDNFLLEDTLKEIGKLFVKAILWNKENLKDLKEATALFRYYFAHAMPFERGSAAISEWFETAIYHYHNFKRVTYSKDKQVDLEALTTPSLPEFMQKYESMISVN